MPQEFGLYPTLTAEQPLDYLAKLKGVVDDEERQSLICALLEKVNLSAARRQKVGEFFGRVRQRSGIAQALIENFSYDAPLASSIINPSRK